MNRNLVDQPKPPFALYRKKGESYDPVLTVVGSEIWCCGECGTIHNRWVDGKEGEADQQLRATECCLQKYCSCGNKIDKGYTGPKCSPCNRSVRERDILAKAVEIEDPWKNYEGPVFHEHTDQYWHSLDEFSDWVHDKTEDGTDEDEAGVPEFVFPCTVRGFRQLNAYDFIQNELEDNHHEDAEVDDLKGLEDFLKTWCDKQTLQSWDPDYKRKIRVSAVMKPEPKVELNDQPT